MGPFHEGLVSRTRYLELDSSQILQSMSGFSESFLQRNMAVLSDYAGTWTPDPLGNWSRRWEYPFVGTRIVAQCQNSHETIRWLDAGSGITFFPFWARSQCPTLKITCLDSDQRFLTAFKALEESCDDISFVTGNLLRTGLPDHSYDIASCISVLEHLDQPEAAVQELARLLKPGGRLLLTFDIGLDGFSTLDPKQLETMIAGIHRHFDDPAGQLAGILDASGREGHWVDTEWIARHWPERLPWKFPRLSAVKAAARKRRITFNSMKILTFSCHDLIRKSSR